MKRTEKLLMSRREYDAVLAAGKIWMDPEYSRTFKQYVQWRWDRISATGWTDNQRGGGPIFWVQGLVPECDFTDTKYPMPVMGGVVVAATAKVPVTGGRWKPIMYAGPEYLEEKKIRPVAREKVIRFLSPTIEIHGGYIDF